LFEALGCEDEVVEVELPVPEEEDEDEDELPYEEYEPR
jgi:hypothetical protein